MCGAFDLFHIGHLSFLEEAAKLGDYLIVGILADQVSSPLTRAGPRLCMELQVETRVFRKSSEC